MNKERIVTTVEAMDLLGRSKATITQWCKSGFIKGATKRVGPGRQPWLIPVSEIRRLGGEV